MILHNVANKAGTAPVGVWLDNQSADCFSPNAVTDAVTRFRQPAYLVRNQAAQGSTAPNGLPCMGVLPALYPEWLGGSDFTTYHGIRFPYVAGAMARGIASTDLVIAMVNAGMLSFFGSAGLSLQRIEQSLILLEQTLGNKPWGCNLINSITDPRLEEALVNLLLQRSVRRVSASAYMELTPALVRYAYSGVHTDAQGQIVRHNHVFAKISRPDVARHFMSPPPEALLARVVANGGLTPQEAALARRLPVAEDYIVESHSGGHTDSQPLGPLLPTILQLRDQTTQEFGYVRPIRIGAAGGLGTPGAVASAFALGAQFVVTGSVNQGSLQAGISDEVKRMLAVASLDDFAMCPCADMFELGAKVQVLKRGTMFAVRATQLYDLYSRCASLDEIPPATRARLEKQVFRTSLDEIWTGTREFFLTRNPEEVKRAEADPKHKMALVFRWYMGKTSQWPIAGTSERSIDYQIWSGPAMGAFNRWVKDSFLEQPEARDAVQIALNLLEGAATITRALQLRAAGISVPQAAFHFHPRPLA